jgi:hypothetical protein
MNTPKKIARTTLIWRSEWQVDLEAMLKGMRLRTRQMPRRYKASAAVWLPLWASPT